MYRIIEWTAPALCCRPTGYDPLLGNVPSLVSKSIVPSREILSQVKDKDSSSEFKVPAKTRTSATPSYTELLPSEDALAAWPTTPRALQIPPSPAKGSDLSSPPYANVKRGSKRSRVPTPLVGVKKSRPSTATPVFKAPLPAPPVVKASPTVAVEAKSLPEPQTDAQFVQVMGCALDCLIKKEPYCNDKMPERPTIFHSKSVPAMTMSAYMEHIAKYTSATPSAMLFGMGYLQCVSANPKQPVDKMTIHRLLITCVMLGCKFYDDDYEDNAFWAHVGGLTIEEMNKQEVELLFLLQFKLFCTTDELGQVYKSMLTPVIHSSCKCMKC